MPYKVLIVDADPSALAASMGALSVAGYAVRTATSFDAAKEQLEIDSPDLLIVDVRLGDYNGLHLVVRAHAEHPELVAIVTHAIFDPVLEAEAAAQGAAYLTKPIIQEMLLGVVVDLLAGRNPQESTSKFAWNDRYQ